MSKNKPSFDYDIEEVEKLYAMACTDVEVAAFFGVTERTIYNWKKREDFKEAAENGVGRGNVSLKRAQFNAAINGNITMLIWLGKNRLGQTDRKEETVINKTPEKIKREIVDATLRIQTARWFVPFLAPNRLKGLHGGRAGGKSHAFAELIVEMLVMDPDLNVVCIREIQKSLKFSSKKLIEDKIAEFGLLHLFDILITEIRSKRGSGIILFQGMQDHTADSIKSLEGFDIAWVEEAQCLSKRSIELLTPTIRKNGSELWFSWNRTFPGDPVELLFANNPGATIAQVNYTDNPFCPQVAIDEAEQCRKNDIQSYHHIWMGEYNFRNEAQVFHGKFRVGEVDTTGEAPMFGIDFGFSQDPTVAVEVYLIGNVLFINRECGRVGLELDATAAFIDASIPLLKEHVSRADSARPESISYLMRHGIPKIQGVKKGKGSVQDGVEIIRSLDEVVIHPRCVQTLREFQLYSHKINRHTGDILNDIEDKHNHYIDAIRYAIQPVIAYRTATVAW